MSRSNAGSAKALRKPASTAAIGSRSRFGPEKQRALEVYGGGEETERAVAAGLEYLAVFAGAHPLEPRR